APTRQPSCSDPPTSFPSFPYHPCVPDAERDSKVPAWLNDVSLYHNRGDTTFSGENSLYGDFFGLDDLFTENPRVVDGFIDIYETWIRDFRIDGFRMDTMKHVDDLPTVLGKHDRGRIGMFVRNANPGASEAELLRRDELAHELMYFSRGDPVVYYGDEQGFTGAGGDQDARQDMFPSQSLQYNNLSDPIPGDDGAGNNDDIGSDATPMD